MHMHACDKIMDTKHILMCSRRKGVHENLE